MISFFASSSRSTCVRLVFSSVAMRFFDILFSFMAWASCQATTSLTACACASSKSLLLFHEVINAGTHVFLAHRTNSFWRLRANTKSSSGVARVF